MKKKYLVKLTKEEIISIIDIFEYTEENEYLEEEEKKLLENFKNLLTLIKNNDII